MIKLAQNFSFHCFSKNVNNIWLHNDIGPIVLAFKSGSQRVDRFRVQSFCHANWRNCRETPLLLKVVVIHIATRSESCVARGANWFISKKFFCEIQKIPKELYLARIFFLSIFNPLLYNIWNEKVTRQSWGQKKRTVHCIHINIFSYLI